MAVKAMVMDAYEDELGRIAFVSAVELPPGAVIVVKTNRMITPEQAQLIREHVSQALPGHEVLVLSPELDLDVLVPAAAV